MRAAIGDGPGQALWTGSKSRLAAKEQAAVILGRIGIELYRLGALQLTCCFADRGGHGDKDATLRSACAGITVKDLYDLRATPAGPEKEKIRASYTAGFRPATHLCMGGQNDCVYCGRDPDNRRGCRKGLE